MTTSPITRRRPTVRTATTTAVLLAAVALAPHSAHAVPDPIGPPAATDRSVDTDGHRVDRACFITPPRWNDALDGPLPRCHTYLP